MAVPMVAALATLALAAPASADEYLQGGGFEGGAVVEGGVIESEGIDHPSWVESDSQFVSPLCSTALVECNIEKGPRGGKAWALFGAYAGPEVHKQSISQTVTLPAVEKGGVLSFFLQVVEFKREAALKVKFDGLLLQSMQRKDLEGFGPGYEWVSWSIAQGGPIAAGPHEVTLEFISDAGEKAESVTILNVDDVSFTATPVPVAGPPIVTPPAVETRITKTQLFRGKKGRKGKPGKPAKAKFFFAGSGGDGSLKFECRLDEGAFKACSSPVFYKSLKLGKHRFEVRAVDGARRDPTPASYSFKSKAAKAGKRKLG
jgi:hypothetical protein